MKIFVIGGAGFISSNFIRHVLGTGKGYKVVNYDKLTYAGILQTSSVLSNSLLIRTFGFGLPDWRTQLQRLFSIEREVPKQQMPKLWTKVK